MVPPRSTPDDGTDRPSRERRPPRWVLAVAWSAILVELTVAVAGVVGGLLPRHVPSGGGEGVRQGRDLASILAGDDQRHQVGDRRAHAAAVRELLAARADAVLRRDLAAFLATVDPAARELRARQAAKFDNLLAVPLASWSYRLDPGRETPLPPAVTDVYGVDAWAPTVQLRFALAGFDDVPTVQEQRFLFSRYAGRWYLADDGAGTGSAASPDSGPVRNVWDFGPVRVMRSRSLLVLGHPGGERLMGLVLSAAEVAVPRVGGVLPGWNRRTVVVVPADATELAAVVEQPGDLSGVAAFASADTPRDGPPTGKRVVVNPAVFGDLSPVGRQIVLAHEMTHVAVRDVTSRTTPHWLAEGFADYVAYRGARIPIRTAARELADEIEQGQLPDHLPVTADFDSANPRLAQAYQLAWLACRLLAERIGTAALVRLYRRASVPGADVDAVLRSEAGMSTVDFVTGWRTYLGEQLT